MRVPTRRSDKVPRKSLDYKITIEKHEELREKLSYLKNEVRPKDAKKLKILSTTGDYSENAGYQLAKSNLRRLNNRISKIENIIRKADIIEINKDSNIVEIGTTVELEIEKSILKYQILGSLETDPGRGFISYNSPLGSILLGKKLGDSFELNNKHYKIKKIS